LPGLRYTKGYSKLADTASLSPKSSSIDKHPVLQEIGTSIDWFEFQWIRRLRAFSCAPCTLSARNRFENNHSATAQIVTDSSLISLGGLFTYANRQSTAFACYPLYHSFQSKCTRLVCGKKKKCLMWFKHLSLTWTILLHRMSLYGYASTIRLFLILRLRAKAFLTISPASSEKTHFAACPFLPFSHVTGILLLHSLAQRPLPQTVVHFSRFKARFSYARDRERKNRLEMRSWPRVFPKYCRRRPRQRLKLQFKLRAGTHGKVCPRR